MILVPAAVLVLVILGAIAVDSAVVYLGQRQLANAAAVAATDAAGAISRSEFYEHGAVTLDPHTAESVARASLRAQSLRGVTVRSISVQVADRQVCVALVGDVRHILGTAVPGIAPTTVVRARATATAAESGVAVPQRSIC